jgi:hypothetical protein
VDKSIEVVDDKAQLVNDLTEGELLPDLVYGTDGSSTRGYKPDYGGRIKDKEVDDSGLADGVVPVYRTASGKYELEAATAGDVVGPAGAVSGNVPEFDGATGKLLADSGFAAHEQDTDQGLDTGGPSAVTAAEVKDAVDAMGYIGTKDVDESAIGDGKVPVYRTGSGKYELETAGGGGADTDTVIIYCCLLG